MWADWQLVMFSFAYNYMQSLSLYEVLAVAYNPLLEFMVVFFMQPALKDRDLAANFLFLSDLFQISALHCFGYLHAGAGSSLQDLPFLTNVPLKSL